MKEEGLRVVVTGKGGVGKTTIAAMLSHLISLNGYNVLAVDEDPQVNLPYALGISPKSADMITPLSKNLDYIEEKTGARPGEEWGLYLKLNPRVNDVVKRFGIIGPNDIKILVMGTVVQAAAGCLCPENVLLNAVMKHLILRKKEVIIMDTQAGMEHFGRAVAEGFSHAIIVVTPSFNSVKVGTHLINLAKELDIPHILLLINKVRSSKDLKKVNVLLEDNSEFFDSYFVVPYDSKLLDIEPNISPLIEGKVPSKVPDKIVELSNVIIDQV